MCYLLQSLIRARECGEINTTVSQPTREKRSPSRVLKRNLLSLLTNSGMHENKDPKWETKQNATAPILRTVFGVIDLNTWWPGRRAPVSLLAVAAGTSVDNRTATEELALSSIREKRLFLRVLNTFSRSSRPVWHIRSRLLPIQWGRSVIRTESVGRGVCWIVSITYKLNLSIVVFVVFILINRVNSVFIFVFWCCFLWESK